MRKFVFKKFFCFLLLIFFLPNVFSLDPANLAQSTSPASPQNIGTTVTFKCDYTNSSGNDITGADVNVVIDGSTYAASWSGSDYQYSHYFGENDDGTHTWYCTASDPSGKYESKTGASQNYVINPLYCKIAWESTSDYKSGYYKEKAGGNLDVAVKLTDSGGNAVSGKSVDITSPWGAMQTPTSDADGVASTTFSGITTTPGTYSNLKAVAPKCLNGISTQNTITTNVNVFHADPNKIVITSPTVLTVNPNTNFDVSIEIWDAYNNLCDSSYDGEPFKSVNEGGGKFSQVVGIYQEIYNSSGIVVSYDPKQCTFESSSVCFYIFNGTENGKRTFTLKAYGYAEGNIYTKLENYIKEVTVQTGSNFNDYSFWESGVLDDSGKATVNYPAPPVPKASGFTVIITPPSIKVNQSFNITIQAVFPNGQIDTSYNGQVNISRLPRADINLGRATIAENVQLTDGNGTYTLSEDESYKFFNTTGIYQILAEALDTGLTGSASLSVSSSGMGDIYIEVDPPSVFTEIPFTVTATIKDSANNTVTDFAGQVNLTCPPLKTIPSNATLNITPIANRGVAVFSNIIANSSGNVKCNITAFDPSAGVLKSKEFTVIMVTPLGCVNYSIPPTPPLTIPVDTAVDSSYFPPVSQVMKHNYDIGDLLIGYDPATGKMNGNYSICLESYHSGKACFNMTTIQFDKTPVAVCVKEFIYNPEADLRISDHINYEGTGGLEELEETFKHPEVLWGWGYKAFDGTSSVCVGNDRYDVQFTPGNLYTDYLNITVTLPLTSLQPYNITNDSILNPHELRAPEALLVIDHKNNGRLGKFTLNPPSTWLEDYNGLIDNQPIPGATSLIDSNAQAIAYDNRGNFFIALTNSPKVQVVRIVRGYPPTIQFVTEFETITEDGQYFFPYGLDTDSWGNIYVLGNTDPDMPSNHICINKYDKDFKLNASNNCTEAWEGTARDITVTEDGASLFVVFDKQRKCDILGICYWIGYPFIHQYNASNPAQLVSDPPISIFGADGGMELQESNPEGVLLDGPCTNEAGNKTYVDNVNETQNWFDAEGGYHYLRGIKYRKGYLFVIDYMAFPVRTGYFGCSGFPMECLGCCMPGCLDLGILGKIGCYKNNGSGCTQDGGCLWCPDPNNCNACLWYDTQENQMTRILVLDTVETPGKQYRARVIIEPNETVTLWKAWYDPWGLLSKGLQYVAGKSSETHGIDVDEKFNVYVALKGKRNMVVKYQFLPGVQDPSYNFPGGSYSFVAVKDYNDPLVKPDDVDRPDDVIGYPDLIKMAMMAGVSCEGCSQEGAVEPSVCQGEIEKMNATEYSNLEGLLTSGSIAPGSAVVKLSSPLTPVYRKNFLSTNITAFLRFDYTFTITKYANGCPSGGSLAGSSVINKQLNITSYSNNLERLVEGGGSHFSLIRPSYLTPPKKPPNTLPYLAYEYLTNRFFYKHFVMMDNVADYMAPPDTHQWILNASYRKTFNIMQNQYYGYQYLSTTPTTDQFGFRNPIYIFNYPANQMFGQDPNAIPYILTVVDSFGTVYNKTIPFNNTMNWSYPFAYVFSPVRKEPNPLPFAPQDAPPEGASDYYYQAITNVSTLLVSILCETSSGVNLTFSATVTNSTYTPLGYCYTIHAISATGAPEEASLFIMPANLSTDNGICFESIFGRNSSMCYNTRAWFKRSIPPNTVVSQSGYDDYIYSPTRYPLLGEPYAPFPSSLLIKPVIMTGPTLLVIDGNNASRNPAIPLQSDTESRISGVADLVGKELPNPLPFRNVTSTNLYFRSDDNATVWVFSWPPMHWCIVPYQTSLGWVPACPTIPRESDVLAISIWDGCERGCLLQFSTDPSGSNIIGELFLWKGQHAYYDSVSFMKIPSFTYMSPRGMVQVVPDDPRNRNFMFINSVSGSGHLGDQFEVYTDPDVTLYVDNFTVGNCTPCTADVDCSDGKCIGGFCQSDYSKCGVGMHPSGPPCAPSFVCPRIDLSLFNESVQVASTMDHSSQRTTVTIVGTDTSGNYNLINGSAELSGGSMNYVTLDGGAYSAIYIIDVKDAIKGESLIFRTATTNNEVARFYLPAPNYTIYSSIATILPNPRKLRINSNMISTGRTIGYTIKGTRNNNILVEESSVGTPSLTCALPKAAVVQPDPAILGCEFQFDPITSPQTAGVAFPIRIRAVPLGTIYPVVAAESSGCLSPTRAQAPPERMLGMPDDLGACFWEGSSYPALLPGIYGTFGRSLKIAEFRPRIKPNPTILPGNDIILLYVSNDTDCWNQVLSKDVSTFKFYGSFVVDYKAGWKEYQLKNGTVDAVCFWFKDTGNDVKGYYVDSLGVYPPFNICPFNGNVTLSDTGGAYTRGNLCPTQVGPFYDGVWSGYVMLGEGITNEMLKAENDVTVGFSNSFNITTSPGVSLVSFETNNAFTHVLSIKIEGMEGEHFNITTAPLYVDGLSSAVIPEQIGVINVVPNDFVLGFYQNKSGTFIYSQQDSVVLNIPDNDSLGLHNFQYRFYDRFNNTFIVPYTIWLRQPTAITMEVQTVRDPDNINRTIVYVTAQLLYQRWDKPEEKPNTPLPNQRLELYVQNSSTTLYGDGSQLDPVNCNPAVSGVCPIPPEESNCSCPDWIDDPANPGECIPNPVCHQYGRLADLATGNDYFITNATGHANTTFKIYGFGRRLLFGVFWGTDVYAPSIEIKPFYAGGVSVGIGKFLVLEPLVLVAVILLLMRRKRKFNK